jgi:putative transposase
VPRSTYYHQSRPESAENLRLLRALDELYLRLPFFGSRKMAVQLGVGRHRARRLMGILGIEAHYPKPHLSRPAPGHQIYPYLLRGVAIERPNQVWSTDITYNSDASWLSLSGRGDGLAQPLCAQLGTVQHHGDRFCVAALDAAFRFGQPEIWNSDQARNLPRPTFWLR